ncbi:MAG: dephospho-CoA kinase [Chloroflexi bacterium]|nr:dephospho-CoA kinase [Chloroflexota bacterium]
MTVRIGLTGPIACGKSTVAAWLRDLGADVIDADAIARRVVEPGTQGLRDVLVAFGDRVRAEDGGLDRAALAEIVFQDPAQLDRLEHIIHPAVRPRILDAIDAAERMAAPAVVIEAIKLVEGGLAELCDEVWLVVCRPEEQRARLIGRGASAADAAARLSSQGAVRTRLEPFATRVIETSGPIGDARQLVEDAYRAALVSRTGMAPAEPED